jgi:ATP-dependent Clp protease ATP-binding subunit ClpA
MFERFTAGSRRSVVLAQEEARMLHHPQIGTEHLLLGLLGLREDPATAVLAVRGLDLPTARLAVRHLHSLPGPEIDAAALDTIGIDLEAVREKVEAVFGVGALSGSSDPAGRRRRGARRLASGHLPFTSDAKKSLELALREALALQSKAILPGHVLLGLLRADDTPAVRLLRARGLDSAELRAQIRAALSD